MTTRTGWIRSLLLVALSAAAFAAVVPRGGWVFDDHVLIERNTELREPGIWWSAFGRDYYATSEAPGVSGYYRPLAVLCNALDVQVWGGGSQRAHVTNLALHVLATLAVAPALGALGVPALAAWTTALVFAVHPVHAESVAFVSGRVDVLATLFILLALGAAGSQRRLAWLLLGLASLCAFLSKESAIVLPLLVLLVWWRRRRSRVAWSPAQGIALALAIVVALLLRAQALPSLLPTTARGASAASSLLLPLQTLFFALASLWAPVFRLVVEPDPAQPPVLRLLVGSVVALLAWGSAALLAPGKRGAMGLCAVAGLVSLLPVLNVLPQETRLSERFLYLPSAFWLAPLGLLVALAWERRPAWRPLLATALALAVVFLGSISTWRARLWRTDLSVWGQAVREEPQRGAFWDRLGLTHMERRAFRPAEAALRRAVQLDPSNFNAWHNLGVLLETKRSYREAVEAFRRALELQPRSVSTHIHLGRIFVALRDLEAAHAEFAAALAVKPDHVEALRMAAMVAIQIEDFEAAERYLETARRIEPNNRAILAAIEKLERRRQGM